MRFGSLIHEVLEEAERHALASGRERSTSVEAIEWLTRVWEKSGFGDDAVGRAWRRRAVKMLDDMYRLWPSSARPVALETPLHLTIDGTPWYGVADRIEAIGQEVVIVDYKTGAQMTKADAAESLQLGYYAMAAAEDPDITLHGTVSAAEFWYPKIANAHAIGIREFNMDNLDTVRHKLIEITSAIQDETFEPTPGPQCESCNLELVCPARAAGAEAFA
jgi:CRISPR/Cas system-associated exonuclease Cas4 (RecB family)